MIHAHKGNCRWEDIEVLHYKSGGGTTFKDVTRQILFDNEDIVFQWRYFEIAPGGYSSLERHEHAHAVMIVRGHGSVFLGDAIYPVAMYDLVFVPPLTWHQFQPLGDEPLGFLCIVNSERDRPQLPSSEQMAELCANPAVGEFIKA
jgi:mannose-6-phosphate isomerase-like protein (cupin superfamily)